MSISIGDLDALYDEVDAFWQQFAPWRERATRMSPREIMTILILFQQSGYRSFKGFSTQYVQTQLRAEFPQLVCYTRFVALIPRVLLPLAVYLQTQLGQCCGISFVDSTALQVCHNAHIAQISRSARTCAPGSSTPPKALLRKRASSARVNDQLKNIGPIAHSRPRSPSHVRVHLLAGLIAECPLPKKPSLHLDGGLPALPAA